MNSLYKNNKMFLVMTIIYKILHVLSGLDYGFIRFKSVTAKVLVKLLSFVICATLIIVTLSIYIPPESKWSYTWLYLFLFKYIINGLFLIFQKSNRSLYSLHCDLHSIDSKFGVDSASFNLELKLICTVLACSGLRLLICLMYCIFSNFCLKPVLVSLICMCLNVCLDVLLVSYTFIFCAINCRLKKFTSILEKAELGISNFQFIYKLYIDTVEKYKRAFDLVLIIAVCFIIPEIMATVYFTVVEMRNHILAVDDLAVKLDCLMLLVTLVMTVAPAINAGKLSTQADRIKVVLHDKLMQKRDNAQIHEIEQFIRYVEARPCRFRVWKVIPLDADLLGMVLSFCVTYLIVIIQFTHIY